MAQSNISTESLELSENESLVTEIMRADDLINVSEPEESSDILRETISKPTKLVRLPISKIKHIMKMDPDIHLIQQDAVFLVCKATELFIEYLAKETNKQLADSKRKTVMMRDVEVTIENIPQLCFLDGALE